MDNTHNLQIIAGHDKAIWRLFSLLNKKCNEHFHAFSIAYEQTFKKIKIDKWYDNEITYYLNGVLHRSNGPALISDYIQAWYYKGYYHRLDGPAVTKPNYCNYWYVNGLLHRTDGPAIEYYQEEQKKYNSWYINGEMVENWKHEYKYYEETIENFNNIEHFIGVLYKIKTKSINNISITFQ